MPVPQEVSDALITRLTKIKLSAFDEAKYIARGDISPEICGYKSREDALIKIILRAATACEKEIVKIERQYPD